MSTVATLANCIVTVKRPTAYLLDAVAVAASHTIDRQPPAAGLVQVEVTGSPTGTVTVAGTVDGLSDTEVLTYSGASSVRTTTKRFTAVSGITTSLSGGTLINAKSVSPGGAPQSVYKTVVSDRPAERRVRGAQSFPMLVLGQERKEGAMFRLQYEDTWRPLQGDVLVVASDSLEYEVQGKPRAFGDFAPDHWQIQSDLIDARTV